MKKQILIASLALISAVSFAQKKEIRKAEKAIKSNDFAEAMTNINEAEGMIDSADNDMKASFYAAKGQAYLGSAGDDLDKLKTAAESFKKAISLDNKKEAELAESLQKLRSALINSAVKDQNAEKFDAAADRLYTSYMISKKDTSDLYFAAGNEVNGKNYDKALEYYQTLLDEGYTGAAKEYVATSKESGEVQSFDNENLRNIAVKSGQFIKPESHVTESKKGEILRNMTLIYIERGNNDKAKQLMEAARAENPNDIYLMRADADMAYKMNDLKRYSQIMNEIVASDPDNPEIYFNLGASSAEIGDNEKAIGFYTKALELKPEYESALINLAVLKLSGEDKLVEEMNKLGNSSADNKKYDELKQDRLNIYKETMPYLEKAIQINPDNTEVIRTLMNIYGQMGEDAKFKEMKTKLDSLSGEQ